MIFWKNRKHRKELELRKLEQRQAQNRDRLEREICASLSRGSVSLQNGDYITSDDLDDVQSFLANYFLKDRKNKGL